MENELRMLTRGTLKLKSLGRSSVAWNGENDTFLSSKGSIKIKKPSSKFSNNNWIVYLKWVHLRYINNTSIKLLKKKNPAEWLVFIASVVSQFYNMSTWKVKPRD